MSLSFLLLYYRYISNNPVVSTFVFCICSCALINWLFIDLWLIEQQINLIIVIAFQFKLLLLVYCILSTLTFANHFMNTKIHDLILSSAASNKKVYLLLSMTCMMICVLFTTIICILLFFIQSITTINSPDVINSTNLLIWSTSNFLEALSVSLFSLLCFTKFRSIIFPLCITVGFYFFIHSTSQWINLLNSSPYLTQDHLLYRGANIILQTANNLFPSYDISKSNAFNTSISNNKTTQIESSYFTYKYIRQAISHQVLFAVIILCIGLFDSDKTLKKKISHD